MRDMKSKSYQELKDIITEAQKEMDSREDAVIIYIRGTVNHGCVLGIFKDKDIDVKSIDSIRQCDISDSNIYDALTN